MPGQRFTGYNPFATRNHTREPSRRADLVDAWLVSATSNRVYVIDNTEDAVFKLKL